VSVPAARLAAQAKVNLALRVGGRRPDGYHELATIFARIDLADDVVLRTLRSGISLRVMRDGVPDESVGPAENNLALLAARAYMRETQWPPGCGIDIEKRIPVGAGLGGGSADAGSVLRGLDSLAPRPLGVDHLLGLAATLGADVPFLALESELALGTGRGDVVETVRPLPTRWLALVLPPFSVATSDAYAWLDADRTHERDGHTVNADALRTAAQNWDALETVATNDLQRVVASRFPQIDMYCDILRARDARLALMSGSGSAVFGVFAEQPDVAEITRACNAPTILARVPARVVASFGRE
jgi:4-diphosphocytidyl-2-C-methyl-D-erythritol kinase